MMKLCCSDFKVITANFSDVQIFRIFSVVSVLKRRCFVSKEITHNMNIPDLVLLSSYYKCDLLTPSSRSLSSAYRKNPPEKIDVNILKSEQYCFTTE